jgi:hypothetical protein
METIFESIKEEKGYFTLHANVDKKLIYYGFITEKSSYYDPEIFIDNPDDPFINIDDIDEEEYEIMYACTPHKRIITKNEHRAERWAERQIKKGYDVKVVMVNGWVVCSAIKNC